MVSRVGSASVFVVDAGGVPIEGDVTGIELNEIGTVTLKLVGGVWVIAKKASI